MLPTPDTSHVSFKNVYEPAEDSFLLMDTMASDQETSFLRQRFKTSVPPDRETATPLVVEIGSGSGVVLAFAAANVKSLFGRTDALFLATDLNIFACQATSETVTKSILMAGNNNPGSLIPNHIGTNIPLGSLNASLASCIRPKTVDVLLFNPPYVPSEEVPDMQVDTSYSRAEMNQPVPANHSAVSHLKSNDFRYLALATDGGPPDGMFVTTKLLDQLPEILNPMRGVAYVLLCARNKPAEVRDRIHRTLGTSWKCEIVGESGVKGGWERLSILKIWVDSEL